MSLPLLSEGDFQKHSEMGILEKRLWGEDLAVFLLFWLSNYPEPLPHERQGHGWVYRYVPQCSLLFHIFPPGHFVPLPVAFCCCLLARNLFLLPSYSDYTWPYLGGVVPVMILCCAVTTWYSCIFGIYLIPFSPLEMALQSSMILAIASQTWSLMLPLNMCLCLVSKSLMSS